jgi:hypothetical protein
MPILPVQKNLISTDVPSVDTGGASPIGAATANFGAQLEQTGFAIKEQLKRTEAIATSQQYALQDKMDSEVKWQQMKASSPDGYVYERDPQTNQMLQDEFGRDKRAKNTDGTDRTITQEYRDWANDRYQKNQLQLPSDMAQEMYRAQSGEFYTNQLRTAEAEEHVMRTTAIKQQIKDQVDKLATKNYDFPGANNEDFYSDYDRMIQSVKALAGPKGYDAAETHQMVDDATHTLALNRALGQLRAIREETGGDKKSMVSQTKRLMDFIEVISGHPREGTPNVTDPSKGGNYYEGTMALDPVTGKYNSTSMTQRRQQMFLPAMTDMLKAHDRNMLVNEAWSMIKGQAKEMDLSALSKLKEQYVANAKTPLNRLPESDLAAQYGNFQNLAFQALGTGQKTPIEVGSDLLDMRAAYFEGKNATVTSDYQNAAARTAMLKNQSAFLKQNAEQLVPLLNQNWKGDPQLQVTAKDLIGMATEKMQTQGVNRIDEITRKQQHDFAGLVAEREPELYRRYWGAFDPKNPDTLPNNLSDWFAHVDVRAKSALGYEQSKNTSGIPENMKNNFVQMLENQPNNELRAKTYRTVLAKLGPQGTRVLNALADSGAIPDNRKLINTFALSQNMTEDMASAAMDSGEILKKYSATDAFTSTKPDDIMRTVRAKFGTQIQGVVGYENKPGGDALKLDNMLVDVISKKAMLNVANSNGSLSVDEAIKGAGEDFIGRMYWVSNSGGFFNNGTTKGQLPVPRYQVVPDVQPGPRAYPKVLGSRYINQEDVGRIADFADSLKKDPSVLLDKYGVVLPPDKTGSQQGLTGDSAKRFMMSNGASLREVPQIRNGVLGIGFVMDTRSEGGSRSGTTSLMQKAPGYTKQSPKYQPVFIPIPTAVEGGQQAREQRMQEMKDIKPAPVFKGPQ